MHKYKDNEWNFSHSFSSSQLCPTIFHIDTKRRLAFLFVMIVPRILVQLDNVRSPQNLVLSLPKFSPKGFYSFATK